MNRTRRWLLALTLLALIGVAAVVGVSRWKEYVVEKQNLAAKSRIEELVNEENFSAALGALQSVPHLALDPQWQRLRVAANAGQRNISELIQAFSATPKSILENEDASLLVARSFAHRRESEPLQQIIKHWQSQTHQTNQWLSLSVDSRLLEGEIALAWEQLAKLESKSPLSPNQLLQRALIKAQTNSVAALQDLDRAVELDSRSSELRSFRGQVLETLGDKQLARVEYVAAHLATPSNPLWRDQLAEFYRRHQQYDFALATWDPEARESTPDFIWLKSLFWSKVAASQVIQTNAPDTSGPLAPLAQLLGNLPSEQFWDEAAFQALSDNEELRRTRQEVYWLSLLQHLLEGNDQAAAKLLSERPSNQGLWDVYLHETLASILRFRRTDRFSAPANANNRTLAITPNRHHFVELIKNYKRTETIEGKEPQLAPDLERLLRGPNAYTAALLAAGWRKSTLVLLNANPDPQLDQYPAWFHYGIAQAKRFTETPQAALTYLKARPSTPELELLRSEILLGIQNQAEALEILRSLADHQSPAGERAAWLLTVDLLNRKQFAEAAKLLRENVNLKDTSRGKELQAKSAVLQGRLKEATEIYEDISPDSAQANRFLADQAFREEDFAKAKKYTLEVLRTDPSNLAMITNLEAIESALEEQSNEP